MNEFARDAFGKPSHDARLEDVVDLFLECYRRGERPNIEDYAARYPDLSDRILEYLPGVVLLEEVNATRLEDFDTDDLTQPAIGEYRLLREIGRGGMGVVYEALQEPLGRRVAFKVLPFRSRGEPRFIRRFLREGRAAARLQHPGIVPIYSFGEERGIHYCAAQLINGCSLDHVIVKVRSLRVRPSESREPEGLLASLALGLLTGEFAPPRRPTPSRTVSEESRTLTAGSVEGANEYPDSTHSGSSGVARLAVGPGEYYRSVANLGKQLADALAYAHGEGVLHRDMKPSNVILDVKGKPWITDFGLSKDLTQGDITASGDVLGTLGYMAPERFSGISDARGDVYGLGLTLYEMLALRPAFRDHDRSRLMRRVIEELPSPLHECEPDVPKDLESIVFKAIQKKQNDRYATAAEMASDLERFVEGRPVHCPPPLPRRHRVRVTASVLGVLTVAAVVLVAFWISPFEPEKGLGPSFVGVEDLDSNGTPDLFTTNRKTGNLSILLNRGSAKPRVRTAKVGGEPQGAAAADFDGDEKLDLAVSHLLSKDVYVLAGDGKGGFRRRNVIPIGSKLYGVVAADFNGDGKPDIATTGGEREVWVIFNGGKARFEDPVTYAAGPKPTSLSLADLDAAGDIDLLTANALSKEVSVLLNDGKGGFAKPVTVKTGHYSYKVVVVDVNADGLKDLVTANLDNGTSVLLGEAGGTFAAAKTYELGAAAQWIAPGDLDGDGDVDLALVGGKAHLLSILENEGGGTFRKKGTMIVEKEPTCVLSTDWDGDGALDLVITGFASNDISILLNKGNGEFVEPLRFSVSP